MKYTLNSFLNFFFVYQNYIESIIYNIYKNWFYTVFVAYFYVQKTIYKIKVTCGLYIKRIFNYLQTKQNLQEVHC